MKPMAKQAARLYRQVAPIELRKGELRKLQIVEAAIQCIARVGYGKTNFETVGKCCNMKRPHVAYHYPNFDSLIETAIRYAFATGQGIVIEYLKGATTQKEQLRAYIEGTAHWIASYPEHASVITLLYHLGSTDEKYRRLNSEFKRLGLERVNAILFPHKGKNLNNFQSMTAAAVHHMIVGACIEWATCDTRGTLKMLVEKTLMAAFRLANLK